MRRASPVDFGLNSRDAGSSFFDMVRGQEPSLLPQFALEGLGAREAMPPVPVLTPTPVAWRLNQVSIVNVETPSAEVEPNVT